MESGWTTTMLALLVLIAALQITALVRRARIDQTGVEQGLSALEKNLERTERFVREEIARNREETNSALRLAREELTNTLKSVGDSQMANLGEMGRMQKGQLDVFSGRLDRLTETTTERLDALKTAVEERLRAISEENAKKLDQMRETVDEKLQGTLEKRLGESFRQVSERLEQVHKGLGEMQSLATGVGDLKKVLSNVKTRGTWGEVQLGALLEQVLAPDQYAANVATKGGRERVEYAVRLPERSVGEGPTWLPIDAKFPVEDYTRLVEAQDRADAEGADAAAKQLESRIRQCAADICAKYLDPPNTTDFGILFLPTEGLFAEVIRRPGLTETLQRDCRVVVAGPTTLWSVLNSLQMGFRSLAIQQRSSEVWTLLSAVKTEWGKYGVVLEKVRKKLDEASHTVEEAERRTRVIGRKLKNVEALPTPTGETILLGDDDEDESHA